MSPEFVDFGGIVEKDRPALDAIQVTVCYGSIVPREIVCALVKAYRALPERED